MSSLQILMRCEPDICEQPKPPVVMTLHKVAGEWRVQRISRDVKIELQTRVRKLYNLLWIINCFENLFFNPDKAR